LVLRASISTPEELRTAPGAIAIARDRRRAACEARGDLEDGDRPCRIEQLEVRKDQHADRGQLRYVLK
jgi:hypothetical protein